MTKTPEARSRSRRTKRRASRTEKWKHRFSEDVQFVIYEASREGRILSHYFVDINLESLPDLRAVRKDHLVAIFSIGYPSAWTFYDFELDDD